MDHVYDYFEQKRQEFKTACSGGVTDDALDEMFQASVDGQSGLIDGLLHFDEAAFVHVLERVELVDGRPRRRRYSYYLVVDATEQIGFDRDLTHDPPHHRHVGSEHLLEPWEEVSFKEAVEEFWDLWGQIRSQQVGE